MTEPSTPTAPLTRTGRTLVLLVLAVVLVVGVFLVLVLTGHDTAGYLTFLAAPVVAALLAALGRAATGSSGP